MRPCRDDLQHRQEILAARLWPVRRRAKIDAEQAALAVTTDPAWQSLSSGVKQAIYDALNHRAIDVDASVSGVNKNSTLTTPVNVLQRVEDRGGEPLTSSMPCNPVPSVDGIQQQLASSEIEACSNTCTSLGDLAAIVSAWPKLPAAIRRAMLALIG